VGTTTGSRGASTGPPVGAGFAGYEDAPEPNHRERPPGVDDGADDGAGWDGG
jgi:hypothetical protein